MIRCLSSPVSNETHQVIADLLYELNQQIRNITDDYATVILNRVDKAVGELGGNVDVFRQQDIALDVYDVSIGYVSDLIRDALDAEQFKEGFADYVANLYEKLANEDK